VADRVSRALRQEADVRRNHEFFNGRNVARTPLSTAGQEPPLDVDPVSSHSAQRSMRSGIFSMQGLREILVGAITSQVKSARRTL